MLKAETKETIRRWLDGVRSLAGNSLGLDPLGLTMLVHQAEKTEPLAAIASDEQLRRFDSQMVMFGFGAGAVNGPRLLDGLATEVLVHARFGFAEDFERAWAELESFVANDQTESLAVAPIRGLSLRSPSIELEPGLTLGPLPESLAKERTAAPNTFGTDRTIGFLLSFTHPRWYDPKENGNPARMAEATTDLTSRAELALRALALVDRDSSLPGFPSIEYVTVSGETWIERSGARSYSHGWEAPAFSMPRELNSADESTWAHTYKKLRPLDLTALLFLDRSLRRFGDGCRRGRAEDRIIEFTIAAEALLLVGVQDELNHRMALHGAAWIGGPPEEREATYNSFRDIYKSRSTLVHGEPWKDKKRNPAELANLAESLMRKSLNKAVDWCAAGKAKDPKKGLLDWDRTFRESVNVDAPS